MPKNALTSLLAVSGFFTWMEFFTLAENARANEGSPEPVKREESYVAIILSSQAASIPQENWQRLKAPKWDFSLLVPPGAKLSAACGDALHCLQVSQQAIQSIRDAGGACGSSSKELALEQREAIGKSRSAQDARKALTLTRSAISSLVGFKKGDGVKVIYGLQDCQGDVSETDLVGWYVGAAAFYPKEMSVQLTFAFQPQESIPVGDSAAYLDKIRTKQQQNNTRRKWEFFEKIVNTIKAEDVATGQP